MRKEVGGSVGILALLAVLVHTQFGGDANKTKAPGANIATQVESGSKSNEKSSVGPFEQSETELPDGPWLATRAYFQPLAPQSVRGIISDIASGVPVGQETLRKLLGAPDDRTPYQAIVTTVADPIHTRLALFTDRQIEAIETGLRPSGWEFARQWLPWGDSFSKPEPDVAARRQNRNLLRQQESIPGVLVFRRAPGDENHSDHVTPAALFVFVVPETPTGGINAGSFGLAMKMATSFSLTSKVGLLAPTFSGSFSSLALAINQLNLADKLLPNVYSGTASSSDHAQILEQVTRLHYFGGIATTNDYKTAFCEVLDSYNINFSDAAYLVEDETGFSSSFRQDKPPCKPMDKYFFPREISHLRNAYLEETAPTDQNGSASSPLVPFSLKDANVGEDSVPIYDEVHSPLSQSSIVEGIIADLVRKRKRMVFISATNVLDLVFLTRLIRREAQDTRVLVGNSDAMFISGMAEGSLAGTLFLSTYPMFFEGQEWLDRSPSEGARYMKLHFAGPEFQGLYNVVQFLAADLAAQANPTNQQVSLAPLQLKSYGQLQDARIGYPGLWLLKLTRSGYLPLDSMHVLNDPLWFKRRPVAAQNSVVPIELPAPPDSWFVTLFTIVLATFLCCGILLHNNASSRVPEFAPNTALRDDSRLREGRLSMMAGGLFCLGTLIFVLSFPAWNDGFNGQRAWQPVIRAIAVLMPLAVFATVVIVWIEATRMGMFRSAREKMVKPAALVDQAASEADPRGMREPGNTCEGEDIPASRERAIPSHFLFAFCYLFALAMWAYCCSLAGGPVASQMFCYRSLELYSGASPALPIGLICLAGVVEFSMRFKQLSLADGANKPILDVGASILPLSYHRDQMNKVLSAPAINGQVPRLREILIVVFPCVVFYFAAKNQLAAFEVSAFNYLLLLGLIILLSSLVILCHNVVLLWNHLSQFLLFLEVLPLRSAVRRVTADWPRKALWSARSSSFLVSSCNQLLNSAHNWSIAQSSDSTDGPYFELRKKFRAMSLPGAKVSLRQFVESRRAYQVACCSLFRFIFADQLIPKWKASINDEAPEEAISNQASQAPAGQTIQVLIKDPVPGIPSDFIIEQRNDRSYADNIIRFGSEFVALGFISYIVYVDGQIQRLARCVYIGLLILALTLHSFAPQSPIIVDRFLMLLFVVMGYFLIRVFVGMEKNATMSRISKTEPGELSRDFWFKVIGFGGIPLIGIVAHLFPTVSTFLYRWIVPGMQGLH